MRKKIPKKNIITEGPVKIAELNGYYQLSIAGGQNIKISQKDLVRVLHAIETIHYGDGYFDYSPKTENELRSLKRERYNIY